MIHQPSGGAQGMASDIAIQAEEILKLRARYVAQEALLGFGGTHACGLCF